MGVCKSVIPVPGMLGACLGELWQTLKEVGMRPLSLGWVQQTYHVLRQFCAHEIMLRLRSLMCCGCPVLLCL